MTHRDVSRGSESPGDERFAEALSVFHQYLSDLVAPLLLVDEAESLTSVPGELLAAEIQKWISYQYRSGGDETPVSDYLYHVARKVNHLRELQVLPEEQLGPFLSRVIEILVHLCPEADRSNLLSDLERLKESSSLQSGPVHVSPTSPRRENGSSRDGPSAARPSTRHTPGPPGEAAVLTMDQMRRMELLFRRLEAFQQNGAPPGGAPRPTTEKANLAAEAVISAASTASHSGELQELLSSMGVPGLPTAPEEILKLLVQRLPDWAAPPDAETVPSPKTMEAVHKVVSMADNPREAARRFGELVKAAAQEFNQGSIGRAVTLLDLAQRMLDKEEVTEAAAAPVQNQGWHLLDHTRIRDFATDRSVQPLLRRVMAFFTDLGVERLIEELEACSEREQRRLILMLLRTWGQPARDLALARLQASIKEGGVLPWFFERNLVLLLREIPRPEDVDVGPEIDALVWLSQPGGPFGTVREALITLGHIHEARAAGTLSARVADLERALLGNLELPYEPDQILSLLDRAVVALATLPQKEARRRAIQHALANRPQFGDAVARIAPLGQQDLSTDPELMTQIVGAIRAELPMKVFGRTVISSRRTARISGLLHALAGTDTPQVRQLLSDIVQGYPGEPLARQAEKVLAGLQGQKQVEEEESSATMSGDLELLSLPNLLQSIADAHLTGTLTLMDDSGRSHGVVEFLGGAVAAARAGHVEGVDAVYHLLQKMEAQRFIFVQRETGDESEGKVETHPILPILLEGMRRLDEYRQAEALVPAGARFKATDKRPSRVEGENDEEFLRDLWHRASSGVPPEQCESEIPVDAYRIRRCYEHWFQEGSLALLDTGATVSD